MQDSSSAPYLREIIQLSVDSHNSIGDAMRKATILAHQLDNDPFKQWVDHELTGYSTVDNLPNYRRLTVETRGTFLGGFGRQMNNALVPPLVLAENYREYLSSVYLMHGVGHYEAEILSLPSNAILKEDIKQDLVALYQDKIYEGFAWMHGWKSFGVSAYRNLVEQVRNRLLTFCVEIQSAMEKGDTEDVGSQLSQLQVTNIFYTTVYGQSSNIAVGGTNVSQSLTSVLVGDIESLAEYLRKHQVDESDIADLRGAIEDDPAPTDHGKLGPRVSDWIGSMVTKAAIGTWGIGANAAGGLLADAIKHYYGLIA